jgi:hypothetical protein
MTWEQRQELHEILNWTRAPVTKPIQYMSKIAVRCYLNGVDAQAKLEDMGTPPFVARRACELAMLFLNNERARRRSQAKQILEYRNRKNGEFTHENFRVKIDPSQDGNYGMSNVSIYAHVEVWVDDDTVEKEYLINFSDYKTKEWLTRLQVWALMNKREILIRPADENVMSTMKMFVPKDKVSI